MQTGIETKGTDADLLDLSANLSLFSSLTAGCKSSYIGYLTSAIARGWSSANMNNRRHVGVLDLFFEEESLVVKSKNDELNYTLILRRVPDLFDIETRKDSEGAEYRISSIERTIVDLIEEVDTFGEDVVAECIDGAYEGSDQMPDNERIMAIAETRSTKTLSACRRLLKEYL